MNLDLEHLRNKLVDINTDIHCIYDSKHETVYLELKSDTGSKINSWAVFNNNIWVISERKSWVTQMLELYPKCERSIKNFTLQHKGLEMTASGQLFCELPEDIFLVTGMVLFMYRLLEMDTFLYKLYTIFPE